MHLTSLLVAFFTLLPLAFSISIAETVSELPFNAIDTTNDTDISIFSPRQVTTLPWPGCVPKWPFCQFGSWQGHQPQMALRLWDANCREIGRNDYVPNLGEGGEFDFDSQLPYVVEVNKYPDQDELPPYIWYAGRKIGDVFEPPQPPQPPRTCYAWQGGKYCFLPFLC
jgi:hypothetical protein